jgi:hypothetical protein
MIRSKSDFGMNKVQNNLAVGVRRKKIQIWFIRFNSSCYQIFDLSHISALNG